jgi:hypothetical protein
MSCQVTRDIIRLREQSNPIPCVTQALLLGRNQKMLGKVMIMLMI